MNSSSASASGKSPLRRLGRDPNTRKDGYSVDSISLRTLLQCDSMKGVSATTNSLTAEYLNQSQGGICICLRRGIVLGIRQQCFGP